MNQGVEQVLKYKFENLSVPETFPQWSSPPPSCSDVLYHQAAFLFFPWLYTEKHVRTAVVERGSGKWPRRRQRGGPSHITCSWVNGQLAAHKPVPRPLQPFQPTSCACSRRAVFSKVVGGRECSLWVQEEHSCCTKLLQTQALLPSLSPPYGTTGF